MSQRSGKKSSPLMILLGILVVGAAVVLQQLGLFETEEIGRASCRERV